MLVEELMTRDPETLDPETSIRRAAQIMRDNDFGVIPVVSDAGGLVGIVTDRDIVIKAVAAGRPSDTPIRECMTPNPDTVPRDATVDQAVMIMSNRQIRRLPVVESGRLIGMLSMADVANSGAPAGQKDLLLEKVSAVGGATRTPEA